MRKLDRRFLLLAGPAALALACEQREQVAPDAADADKPLSVEFAYPNGRTVHLDYLDQKNFRLEDYASSTETLAVGGTIYLYIRQKQGQSTQLWRFGQLATPPADGPKAKPFQFRPTLIPPQGVAHWGIKTDVFDVRTTANRPSAPPIEVTVAMTPDLAHAQWIIASSLLPAMNMSLCGDGVQQLTQSWNRDLTRLGWAVLATSDGFRLDGPVIPLQQTPSLPEGVPARDSNLPL